MRLDDELPTTPGESLLWCRNPLVAELTPGFPFETRCLLDEGHEGPCRSYVEVLKLRKEGRK